MMKVVHLLDDFGMGGVTRALTLFGEGPLAARATSRIEKVPPKARIAPSLDADVIIDHMALSWARLPYLASLRVRNPRAHIIHVEHSYTRGFEAVEVSAKQRFRMMITIAAGMFDRIVSVSNAQREWLVDEVGIPASKVRVIYPWSGRDELLDVPPPEPRKGRPLRLLAYGRFAGMKNFAELIIAMREHSPSQVELTIFGDGPERVTLKALAAGLENVRVCGPSNDPSSYLAECDAVIIPSRYEAFGLVATEARLAGRAIIVADVDGLPEQVGSAGCVVELGSAAEIASAIRWATAADLAAMGRAGRQEVAGQHKDIVRRWLYQFAEVAGHRDQASPAHTGSSGSAMA